MEDEKDYSYTGYNNILKEKARSLRKNMTPQERRLWFCFLKSYPVKIVSQRPIGIYIADFYCSKAKLVIELDGSQHYTDDGVDYDENRTYVIKQFGVEVIRFSNYDIDTNFEGVCLEIDRVISERIGQPRHLV
ncbi:MAG: endonuclease domain-containing protein [Clostridia bacterium]|nr:endonuclease domain-containing protein [Clostridia bacterium]